MCINARLCRVLNHPDDGEDNPKARRSGFDSFASIHDPEDRAWESREIPADAPPVPVVLPFKADDWTDPDRDCGSEAEAFEIGDAGARNRWGFPDLSTIDIG